MHGPTSTHGSQSERLAVVGQRARRAEVLRKIADVPVASLAFESLRTDLGGQSIGLGCCVQIGLARRHERRLVDFRGLIRRVGSAMCSKVGSASCIGERAILSVGL